ncbi:MAG: hypothetical protein ACYDAG_02490 [Chloroflexota bacterium]
MRSAVRRVIDAADAAGSLGGAGFVEGGLISGIHVTDEAEVIEGLLDRGDPIDAHDPGDLGAAGIYISDSPRLWDGRCRAKWSFLWALGLPARMRLAAALLNHQHLQSPGYLTCAERELAVRDICSFLERCHQPAVVGLSNQPFNIRAWEPSFLEPLGIEPGSQPDHVQVWLRGRYADLDYALEPAELIELKRDGVDGAFRRSGMGGLPELVVWNRSAIVRFGRYVRCEPFGGLAAEFAA